MTRRLVKLDPVTGDYAEVDIKRLTREAQDLLDFIRAHIDPLRDKFNIWKTVVPLIEGVLNQTLKLPVAYSQLPLKYEAREGLLPEDFYRLFAEFKLTISGTAREIHGNVDVNGETYTYADFED